MLEPERSILLIVDAQEAFRPAIGDFALALANLTLAVRGCKILGVPVAVTEQYPKGLGRTAEELMLVLPDDVRIFEKTSFSAARAEGLEELLAASGVKQVILGGFETHVCVSQTAQDLIAKGFEVHVLRDGTASRLEADRRAGSRRLRHAGAVPSSVEMVLFELMRDAKHEKFKEVQALIK